MKIYCVFSLESPHRGDSNENTKYTIFSIKKKISLNYPKYAATGFFFQGNQEQVRNSHGKVFEPLKFYCSSETPTGIFTLPRTTKSDDWTMHMDPSPGQCTKSQPLYEAANRGPTGSLHRRRKV